MNVIVVDTREELSRVAADEVSAAIAANPACVLGLATGTTPIGMYDALVSDYEAGLLSFKDVTTFNLDEYRGLAPDHPQSYRYFMRHHLFDRVDIDPERTHLPNGADARAEAMCAAYERAIRDAGGIDLQVLGIGHNGHIGFNEPADEFPPVTHLVQLAERTIEANSRLFDSIDEVPREAYTMGIGTIMGARRILLLATGADKAAIVRDALQGEVTPRVPASVLQEHADVTVLLDKEAAQCL